MNSISDEEKFLNSLVRGIAAQFGDYCEVVLHDLKDRPYDHTIVAIANGHITGRSVGDCGTNLGLEVLRGTDKEGDKYNYVTQTKEGKVLHSTSIYIRDPAGKVVGSLCINLDVTQFLMAEKALGTLIHHGVGTGKGNDSVEEIFTNDVNDLLETLIQSSIKHVGKPVAMMSKEDKMEGIRFLDQKGALLIKKSGDRIAKFYDISKYTLYSYLDGTRLDDEQGLKK
ncbi:MAG: helix-turn-helix transcriptional regulator [Treponemataceae bacterium]